MKITILNSDVVFLKRCKKHHVIPKGLTIKNQFKNIPKMSSLFEKLEFKLLKHLINENYKKLNKLKQKLETSYKVFDSKNDRYLLNLIIHNVNMDCDKIYNLSKQKHIRKLEALLQSKMQKSIINLTNHYTPVSQPSNINDLQEINSVKNLSDRIFTDEEMLILNYGLNFALPLKQHHKFSIEAKICTENGINKFPIEEQIKDKTRIESSKIIQLNSEHPNKNVQDYRWMTPILKSLRTDSSIVILPADKGNVTVILNAADYIEKVQQHLEDPVYQQINLDPTSRRYRRHFKLNSIVY